MTAKLDFLAKSMVLDLSPRDIIQRGKLLHKSMKKGTKSCGSSNLIPVSESYFISVVCYR